MATAGATGRARLPRGAGEHFAPAAGATVLATDGDDLAALVVAAPGTPVHAMCAGRVLEHDGRLVVEGVDGHRWEFEQVQHLDVALEATVDAGDIIGHVGEAAAGGARLRVTRRDGTSVDAARLLSGAPDPNELGYADHDLGLDVDPAGSTAHAPPRVEVGGAGLRPPGTAGADEGDADGATGGLRHEDSAVVDEVHGQSPEDVHGVAGGDRHGGGDGFPAVVTAGRFGDASRRGDPHPARPDDVLSSDPADNGEGTVEVDPPAASMDGGPRRESMARSGERTRSTDTGVPDGAVQGAESTADPDDETPASESPGREAEADGHGGRASEAVAPLGGDDPAVGDDDGIAHVGEVTETDDDIGHGGRASEAGGDDPAVGDGHHSAAADAAETTESDDDREQARMAAARLLMARRPPRKKPS